MADSRDRTVSSQKLEKGGASDSATWPLVTSSNSGWKLDIAEWFEDEDQIGTAMQIGILKARQEHKRAGHPVVEWRDGRVVTIPPEQIESEAELLRLQELHRRSMDLRRVFSILERRGLDSK